MLFLVSFSHLIDPPVQAITLVCFFFSRPVLFRRFSKTTGFFTTRSFWPAKPRVFVSPVPFFLQQNCGFLHDPSLFSYGKPRRFLHGFAFCTHHPFFLMKKPRGFCSTCRFFLPQKPRGFCLSRQVSRVTFFCV